MQGRLLWWKLVGFAVFAAISDHALAAEDIWSRATLAGDWNGLRTQLENSGITITLPYTAELISNHHGGIRRGSVVNGLFQPQIEIDTEKLAGWRGGKFLASAILTHGPGFTPAYAGVLMTMSNIETGPLSRIFELWYEQAFAMDRASVRVGLMAADFMVSDTALLFMNNTYGWNTLFAYDLPAGGPSYPFSAPAVRIRAQPVENTYLMTAVFSGDPSGGNGSNQLATPATPAQWSFSGGAFLLAEAGYTPNQAKGSPGLPGAYKIGAWFHTSDRFGDQRFDTLGLSLANPQSNGIARNHSGNWAFYAVADQKLFREAGSDDKGLSAFFRITGAPADRNLVNFYFDTGLVYTGLFPSRPEDKIGFAAAYAHVSDRARQLDQDTAFFTTPGYPTRSSEIGLELTYQAKLMPWWTLQADLQHVIRPSGGVLNDDGASRRNVWMTGLRSVVSF